tara:strand:- start:2479 stop:3729 length:1251 start_codon:yes stop_codon:yes gene_type:complete
MSTKGVDNWNKHWKGSNKNSVTKKPGTIYGLDGSTYRIITQLQLNTPIVYIDTLTTTHDKAAFLYEADLNNVYYTHIDNFIKPGRVDIIDYTPESFGLTNRYFSNVASYFTEVKKSIDERWDDNQYSGELYEYLIQLIEHAKGGVSDFLDIDYRGFPWGGIVTYFTEVIGPIACVYKNLLVDHISDPNIFNSKIYIPPTSENTYDFKIITDKNEYKISVKSAIGVSNQIKSGFIVNLLDSKLNYGLKNSLAYKLLKILATNTAINGPILGWMLITQSQIDRNMFEDYRRYYNTSSNYRKPITNQWTSFARTYNMRSDANYGNIRFKCESLIEEVSKSGQLNNDLKEIFKIFLNESRVMNFSMAISPSSPRPSYKVMTGNVVVGEKTPDINIVNNVYIRNLNTDSGRVSDRMEYTVQ